MQGQITNRFQELVDNLDNALILPAPAPVTITSPTPKKIPRMLVGLAGEWQNREESSVQLEQPAAGPAGSCLSNDLRKLDPHQCTLASITPSLDAIDHLDHNLAIALRVLIRNEPQTLECRSMRGPGEYMKTLWDNQKPFFLATGTNVPERTFAEYMTPCNDSPHAVGGEPSVARLFVRGGQIIQACMDPVKSFEDPVCKACFLKQDGGKNCDFDKLAREGCFWDFDNPDSIGVHPERDPFFPQVACKPGRRAPQGTVCVPRYRYDTTSLQQGMCVPTSNQVNNDGSPQWGACAPCLAFTHLFYRDLNTHKVLGYTAKQLRDCLDAPAYCRVAEGTSNAKSCDATTNMDIYQAPGPGGSPALGTFDPLGKVRLAAPFRCGIHLPFSRLDVEPDRLEAVLAEAYSCPNGSAPPCEISDYNHLTVTQAKAVIWQELTVLSGAGLNVGASGFHPPHCFPDRSEVEVGPGHSDQLPLGSGPMGFIGQGERSDGWQWVANSPLCGWQDPGGVPIAP